MIIPYGLQAQTIGKCQSNIKYVWNLSIVRYYHTLGIEPETLGLQSDCDTSHGCWANIRKEYFLLKNKITWNELESSVHAIAEQTKSCPHSEYL